MDDDSPGPAADPKPPNRWLKARNIACDLMVFFLGLGLFFGLLALITMRKEPISNLLTGMAILCAGFGIVSFLAWWGVLLFGFFKFRFSLQSLMLMVLGLGTSGALLSGVLDFWGMVVGTILIFILVGVALAWVGSSDP